MIIDIIIGIALVASVVTGIVKGLVKEISVIAGLILGFYIASIKSPSLENFLFKTSTPSSTQHITSFIIIFIIVLVLVMLIGLLVQKAIQLVMLGWLDKLLGGIFGFVKGLIIVWLLIMLATAILPGVRATIAKSTLAGRILELGNRFTKIQLPTQKSGKVLTIYNNNNILIIKTKPVTG